MNLKKPYFVALDMDDPKVVFSLAEQLKDKVGGFKLGPRLLLRYGQEFALKISKLAPLFIDHKFYDIPNTMLSSIKACFDLGASFVTIHAACGSDAMKVIVKLEAELNAIRPFKILGVSVLTSFSETNTPSHWQKQTIEETILGLASDCVSAGLSGLVCSPYEAEIIHLKYPQLFLVTPGIRLSGGDHHDQKRVMTPKAALESGASALVIGRSIVNAENPIQVVESINQSLI